MSTTRATIARRPRAWSKALIDRRDARSPAGSRDAKKRATRVVRAGECWHASDSIDGSPPRPWEDDIDDAFPWFGKVDDPWMCCARCGWFGDCYCGDAGFLDLDSWEGAEEPPSGDLIHATFEDLPATRAVCGAPLRGRYYRDAGLFDLPAADHLMHCPMCLERLGWLEDP